MNPVLYDPFALEGGDVSSGKAEQFAVHGLIEGAHLGAGPIRVELDDLESSVRGATGGIVCDESNGMGPRGGKVKRQSVSKEGATVAKAPFMYLTIHTFIVHLNFKQTIT